MKQKMHNAIDQILENEELSKKLIKLDSLNEIFELFKSLDNSISKEDFEEGINKLLEKSGEKLTDESLSKIAGGTMGQNMKKSLATALAALSLGSTQIHAAPAAKKEIKIPKIISAAALLTTLGISAGVVTLGATFYYLINSAQGEVLMDDKCFYYEIIKNLDDRDLLIICRNFKQCYESDETTRFIFNPYFKETTGTNAPEKLELYQIEFLIKNKEFFNFIPENIVHRLMPKKTERQISEILSKRKGVTKTSQPTVSTKSQDDAKPKIEKKPSSLIKPLINCGNSCHFNATLQLLRHIPEIKNGNLKETNEKIKYLNRLMKLINRGNTEGNEFQQEARDFLKLLYGGNYFFQQDANETLINMDIPYDSIGLSVITAATINQGFPEAEKNPFYFNGVSPKLAKYKIFNVPSKEAKKFDETYSSNGQTFELKSVICQLGDNESGHYWAYSKDENGEWYECNDSLIRGPISFENIKNNHSKNITSFLYVKKN